MASKQIEIWHDTTSDEHAWCVSQCGIDGQEDILLSAHDSKEDALEAGQDAARRHGVRLVERADIGPSTEIFDADEIRLQAMLLRHGDMFTGNSVEDEAEGWADNGFDADSADPWCEIGVWDAATAAELRDAGLTPEQVKAAAESLTEGLEDPAEEYTNGCPIYAACNGDISVSVIIKANR